MKTIITYSSLKEALADLDNGGRFYNILTEADDGVVEQAELAKVAGVFSDTQTMFLYLDMALSELSPEESMAVRSSLSEDLQQEYQTHKPSRYTPVQAKLEGQAGEPVIIGGVPRLVKSMENFGGMILVPITAGTVTTFTMIPIVDQYDVYQVRDSQSEREFVVAHAHSDEKLPETYTLFGGILKEMHNEQGNSDSLFLEAVYFANHQTLSA
ncbi:hypothetical protein [Ferrimonas sp. YFM]|uniref:hypothetical protein n=1 Tax=Ferrimonas sp. YFM TaxID=3028878 RepID=UPI0025722DCD|nr:hypothetical protein [Ferrimonas sp. YFM]